MDSSCTMQMGLTRCANELAVGNRQTESRDDF